MHPKPFSAIGDHQRHRCFGNPEANVARAAASTETAIAEGMRRFLCRAWQVSFSRHPPSCAPDLINMRNQSANRSHLSLHGYQEQMTMSQRQLQQTRWIAPRSRQNAPHARRLNAA